MDRPSFHFCLASGTVVGGLLLTVVAVVLQGGFSWIDFSKSAAAVEPSSRKTHSPVGQAAFSKYHKSLFSVPRNEY
jgi:hypothetical protein